MVFGSRVSDSGGGVMTEVDVLSFFDDPSEAEACCFRLDFGFAIVCSAGVLIERISRQRWRNYSADCGGVAKAVKDLEFLGERGTFSTAPIFRNLRDIPSLN